MALALIVITKRLIEYSLRCEVEGSSGCQDSISDVAKGNLVNPPRNMKGEAGSSTLGGFDIF